PHAAVAGQLERAGHHHLGPGIVRDRAAVAILVDDLGLEAVGEQRERRTDPGGAGADDDRVELARAAAATGLRDRLGGLAALLHRVADQSDAAELADHEDAGLAGLEARGQPRQLDAAGRGAEHQLDRADRTRLHARRVADARQRVEQPGAPI